MRVFWILLIVLIVNSYHAYGSEPENKSPSIIRIIDTLATSYYRYQSIDITDDLPKPAKNANERLDYDLRLPIPIDLSENSKLILFGQAKYNFLDSHDPYNAGGVQEVIANYLMNSDNYSLMLSLGMVKKNYDRHLLSYVLSQVFLKDLKLFSSDLYLKSILARVRNINGRHDYVVVLYMVSDLGDNWQFNLSIPSELSLTKDLKSSLFKFGVRIDGLENLVEVDNSDYWLIGFRAYGFIRYAKSLYDPIWASIELGGALEQFEAFDSKAKEVGTRTAWVSNYALASLGIRIN